MNIIFKFILNKIFRSKKFVKFQNPYFIGSEIKIIDKTIKSKKLIGPDNFIKKSEQLLEKQLECKKVLLTSSGTDAIEMACLLAKFKNGDEVIMPSFNFPSSATSVLRCGAIPVFVDINSSDLNISIESIKKSITNKTKGIILVHYAGISAQMSKIMEIAKSNNTNLRNANGVTLKSPTLSGVGVEPKVVGAMYNAELNTIYNAIEGNRGVYAFKVTKKELPTALPNYDSNRKRISETRKRQTFKVYEAIKKASEIEDNRVNMYSN